MSISEFFDTYFIKPIVEQGVAGYNIYNTPVYAILFAIAVFGAYKLLKKLNITIDRKFAIGIFPFILLGSLFRVLRDSGLFKHWIFVTPLIYFLVFFIALFSLLFAVGIERFFKKLLKGEKSEGEDKKKIGKTSERRFNLNFFEYYKIWFSIGAVICIWGLINLLQIGFKNYLGVGLILLITGAWASLIFGVRKISTGGIKKFLSRENAMLIATHMFDATTTFVALQFFPYYEQHVLSNIFISIFGPVGQFILKLPIIILVLYFLDKELGGDKNKNLRNFLKIAVFILGFALGMRNFLRLGFGV